MVSRMSNVTHRNIKKKALPRTGRELDAMPGGMVSGGGSIGSGGGSVTVDAEFDILNGEAIKVEKSTISNRLTYTVHHDDTSEAVSFEKVDKKALAGVALDTFGHVTGYETCDILALDDLDKRYLRKDMNDKGHGFYEWEAGWMTQAPVRSAEYNIGWEVGPTGWYVSETGVAWYTSLNVRGPILSNNVIGSPYYASGWTGYGSQWDMNKHFLETDYGSFRKEIRAKMFVIDQIRGTNGSLAVSDSNKILRVEDMGNVWRCYIDTYGGDVFMNMRVDDAIKCQRVIKYYLALVTNVSSDYFDLSKTNLEGTGVPEAGDEVIRWDNVSDPDRKGIVYLTSSDSYAPYMDVRYGDWNATVGTIKVREGRLDGINDPLFPELYGAVNNFGLYTSNFYGTGELILRSTGESVSRTFEVLKDSIKMGLDEVRYELQVSQGSVLVNPAFQEGISSWEVTNVYYPWVINNNLLQSNYKPFVNFVSGALIVTDEVINRPVMQVADATVIQRNALFTTKTPGKYSLRFSYRSLLPFGSLEIGVPGSQLNIKVNLSDNTTYQKGEVVGEWDGTGDFTIIVNGVVNISDISFVDDKLANAINEVKVYYDTKLTFYAEKAVMNSFREEYDEFNRVVKKDYATQTWTYNTINTEVGTIVNGKLTNYSTTTQTARMIENKVADLNLGQYATTSWTSNQIRNTVSDLNMGQYATQSWTSSQITSSVKDLASKADLTLTSDGLKLSISKVDTKANAAKDTADTAQSTANSSKNITEAFYKFTSQSMQLNRRIEVGAVSLTNFDAKGGLSPNTDNVLLWGGGNYWQATTGSASVVIRHDGSGWLASKNIMWDTVGRVNMTGSLQTKSNGSRIYITPHNNYGAVFQIYDSRENLSVSIQGPSTTGAAPQISLTDYSGSSQLYRGYIMPSGCGFRRSSSSQVGLEMGVDYSGYAKILGTWYSLSNVPDGCVYKDSSGYLRVK